MARLRYLLYALAGFLTPGVFQHVTAESIQCSADMTSTANALNGSSSFTKPRVFILSDILNEPDDSMSLVRLLVYSNVLDIRGLCATTSNFLRNATHPEEMERIVQAYGTVVGNLNRHVSEEFQFSSSDKLLSLVTSGPKVYGIEALNTSLSEGAQRLIDSLEESEEPLHVSIWGGANTLAQALQHIHSESTSSHAASLRSRLRVYAISDQDTTGTWIQTQWPDIFYVSSMHGFTEFGSATWLGMHFDDNGVANVTKTRDTWVTPNIRVGALGAVYPKIEFGLEGDTPSFLWLIPNGLSDTEWPGLGSWGGRYTRVVNLDGFNWYANAADAVALPDGGQYSSVQATVWRWRDAYQDDFAARMQWTLDRNVSEVSHPPLLNVNGSSGPASLQFQLGVNQSIILDAGKTCDADHPEDLSQLDFEWFAYPAPAGYNVAQPLSIRALAPPPGTNGTLALQEAGFTNVTLGSRVEVSLTDQVSALVDGQDLSLILQVRTTRGPYPIRRYKRIVIKVAP
ncbi:cellulose-binding protein [Colletotrichum karsti]|uniref:Cellulose-binding protein n=1 Tax=Colletotrichum karsti TaxID=1095194 RepID=A0A9P6LMB3_9PEZI|nr:cellulose-binding protein [Colletotrichum karsti]KAF9878041.1 cellulose-binding protein [Colletotrichum karsti]